MVPTTSTSPTVWATASAWMGTSGRISCVATPSRCVRACASATNQEFTFEENSACASKTTCTSRKTAPSCSQLRARLLKTLLGRRDPLFGHSEPPVFGGEESLPHHKLSWV